MSCAFCLLLSLAHLKHQNEQHGEDVSDYIPFWFPELFDASIFALNHFVFLVQPRSESR